MSHTFIFEVFYLVIVWLGVLNFDAKVVILF